MKRRIKKTKAGFLRASILFCVLAGLCLSSGLSRFTPLAEVELTAKDRVSLLSRLTLSDSAVCRLEKRVPARESKPHRRHAPLAPPPSGGNVELLDRYGQRLPASRAARYHHSPFISPQSDRAPPTAL
jgi:hypothetical protein